jgi:dephospho-CoA kinase
MMLRVGVTGGLGAGKTTVSNAFARLGARIIDTDEISRELTADKGAAIPAIRESFGKTLFNPGGSLDRAALRAQILADDTARQRLESILHPMIRSEVGHRLGEIEAGYVLIVIPLLVETGAYDDLLNRVLVVDCSEETQMQRASARGGWNESEIRKMMSKQASRNARLARADDVIDTDCSLASMDSQVRELDQKYQLLSGQTL